MMAHQPQFPKRPCGLPRAPFTHISCSALETFIFITALLSDHQVRTRRSPCRKSRKNPPIPCYAT
ncbi:hypothetical protein B0T26DRAFT_735552 [Lasiosphaeria miniovina]|uniref:Uncharacterized protein n=1 Tax=Lasiosphaeria miniovina TaxID=1954250 RepID=A0AA39ZR48_9PEZI|nr:uncharacterized protein B0T26DRAFT_735552 [Lasiosphaeria miniovina]KAK0702009.1 hypothetical protein B0T26DRAFT_735552 [Lasiosphaeria miniovina]